MSSGVQPPCFSLPVCHGMIPARAAALCSPGGVPLRDRNAFRSRMMVARAGGVHEARATPWTTLLSRPQGHQSCRRHAVTAGPAWRRVEQTRAVRRVRMCVLAYDSCRQRLRPTAEDAVDGDDARSSDLCLDGTNTCKGGPRM